ncbi:MAG TPA: hypothetical protein VF546_07850 [Pyrinomonadaceae bacterium]|jgi:hypothetical protein
MRTRGRIARYVCARFFLVVLVAAPFAPRAQAARAPEAKPIPAGEVALVLPERLFNALLEALLARPQPPTFTLPGGGEGRGGCASEITLEREQAGGRTGVRFMDGQINAPIAFRGTYSAPLVGCLKFQGWADTTFNLSFDQAKQALVARVVVREVHLSKVPAMLNNGITGLVQDALDARVNPVEILRAEQLSLRLSLAKLAGGGALRLRARAVRHEVAPGELRVRILYEFVAED